MRAPDSQSAAPCPDCAFQEGSASPIAPGTVVDKTRADTRQLAARRETARPLASPSFRIRKAGGRGSIQLADTVFKGASGQLARTFVSGQYRRHPRECATARGPLLARRIRPELGGGPWP